MTLLNSIIDPHLLAQVEVIPVESYLQLLGEVLIRFLLKVLAALIILYIGSKLAAWIHRFSLKVIERHNFDETVTSFLSTLIYYALMIAVGIVALGQLGVQTASLVAVIGAAGLAIGLALQGSLSNFAAGVLLILLRPFKVGDLVEVGGAFGHVKVIEIFTTTIKSVDNLKVIIPNAKIIGDNITNYSGYQQRRIDLVIEISYEGDIDQARQIIQNVLDEDDRILDEPAATVNVCDLAESSVHLAVRPWVKSEDYWVTRCDTIETIKKQLDAAGISIPYPQRDLHVYHHGEHAPG